LRECTDRKELEQWLKLGPTDPIAVRGVDLRGLDDKLDEADVANWLFLGCTVSNVVAGSLVSRGALVIPDLDDRPFRTHRAKLYSPDELFAGYDDAESWVGTVDHAVYQHYQETGGQSGGSISETLSRRLHDHSITEALDEMLQGRKVVAIMGGHSLERGSEAYRKVAVIARRLAREGFLMVSGGGPGAMEATHVGAWFAHCPDDHLDRALAPNSPFTTRPTGDERGKGEYADADWLKRAFDLKRSSYDGEIRYESIGIPTWLYGHEPPTVFATHIAKYFANSVREEGLLAIASHGVVFARGSAGTTQEIFQDACQNHYVTFDHVSPMILLGRRYWTEERPVWPLLQKVSESKPYGELVFLSDDVDAIVRRILSYDPEIYSKEALAKG
jgi:predicted Rossmann-fold nucleotide-binding protein